MQTNVKSTSERSILALLFVGVLMGALDIAIVAPALPAMRAALGVDERAIAWVLTAYILCNLIGTPIMATLSDARGRRSIYVLAVGLFAAGSLIVALSGSFDMLIAGRALQGFGAGGIFPVASATIGDIIPVERRGRALGMIGAVFGVAFLIGPILGGVLLLAGWPFLFLINVPVALFVIWRSLHLLPASAGERRRGIDAPGLALLSAALFALAFGLNRIDAEHFTSSIQAARVWPFLFAAALLVPVFWKRQKSVRHPVVQPRLFESRQVIIASGLALGAGLSEAAIAFVPALMVTAFHVTSSRAAFMLLPIVLALAVGAPISGKLLDQYGARVVVVAGCALIGIGMVLVGVLPVGIAPFYGAGILIGFGLAALLGSSLRYVMLNEAPADQRASAQGILTLFTSIGQLLGAAAVGAIVASHGGGLAGYDIAFQMVGVCMIALAAASVALKSRRAELAAARV